MKKLMTMLALPAMAFALAGNAETEGTDGDAALIMLGQEMVTHSARDPDSVEFRDLRVVRHTLDAESAHWAYLPEGTHVVAVCGAVNAKNAFGGYTGWKRMAVFFEGRDHSPIAVEGPDYDDLYMKTVCPA